MNQIMERLLQMYRLAIWDRRGRMYMPVYGYDGLITNYARAWEAMSYWHDDFATEYAEEHGLKRSRIWIP